MNKYLGNQLPHKNQRNSSVELLRLLSMLLILIHHICGQGLGFQFFLTGEGNYIPQMGQVYPIITIIENICIVAVNVFILISGFYGITLKKKNVVSFLFVCIFFSFLHHMISMVLGIQKGYMNTLSIITHPNGWFIRCYFLLMLSSVIINKALRSFSNKELNMSLMLLSFINIYMGFIRHDSINEFGYTLSQFIFIYCIGYALNRYSIKDIFSSKKILFVWICGIFTNFVFMMIAISIQKNEMAFRLLSYNNPIIIVNAICLFLLFIKHNFKSKLINFVASGAFGIYLFHQGRPLWSVVLIPFIINSYNGNPLPIFVGHMVLLSLVLSMVGISLSLLCNYIVTLLYSGSEINKNIN